MMIKIVSLAVLRREHSCLCPLIAYDNKNKDNSNNKCRHEKNVNAPAECGDVVPHDGQSKR